MRRFLTRSVRWLAALAVLALTGWGALALAVVGPGGDKGRLALAAAYGVAGLAAVVALVLHRGLRFALPAFAVVLVAIAGWWSNIRPSNDRDWQPEVAVLAYATIDGDLVTVHNIRNFDYRTETDFTPAYYDSTFDLRKLDGVDLMAVYWMGPAIAHIFLSFGFGDGSTSPSPSRRARRRARATPTVAGFFRQYELFYVVADERDVDPPADQLPRRPAGGCLLSTACGPRENGRRIFLDYVREINALQTQPRVLQHAHHQLHDHDLRTPA